MTNKEIAKVLKETASLIDITGGDPFRSRTYQSAARSIESIDEQLVDLAKTGSLTSVRGIGSSLSRRITELLETGAFSRRDELLNAVPPEILEILRVKGLGSKKVRVLWRELDITSIEALEAAALSGALEEVPGFGTKMAQKILDGISLVKQYRGKARLADAIRRVESLMESLRETDGVIEVQLAGEARRKVETIERVDIVILAEAEHDTISKLASLLKPDPDDPSGWMLDDGLRLQVTVVDQPDLFGTTIWQLTGSESFVETCRSQLGEPARGRTEAEVFAAWKIPFIPPELREDWTDLDPASTPIPELITYSDLKGALHNHTTYSDGAHSLKQMADRTREMGLEYFGVCDHSQSLQVAHGLSVEDVSRQQAEIAQLNDTYANDGRSPFRIFSGIESDILQDGSLDYEDDVLATFDFVVASIHMGIAMTRDEATTRLIRAIENPYTSILGHPTGRVLLVREGYPIDHQKVIDACSANMVSIELNASPNRLDIDWRWVQAASEKGVLISINPDAHRMETLDHMYWGVMAARKGWLTADRCLNAFSLNEITSWFDARKQTRRSALSNA